MTGHKSPIQDIAQLLDRAKGLRSRPRSKTTLQHDASAIRVVRRWASQFGIELPNDTAWPVDVVAAYVASYLDRGAANTAKAYLAAIRRWHVDRGLRSPTTDPLVREALSGLCRALPSTVRQKRPMPAAAIRAWLEYEDPHRPVSLCAKVAILVGYVTGVRAGELCALEWSDVRVVDGGMELAIRRSKTGRARVVGLPASRTSDASCPVAWLEAWRRTSGGSGRVFPRTVPTVRRWAARAAKVAGLDWTHYGAHSLRSGMMTTASSAGVALTETMAAGGWETANVAAKYARPEATQNAAHRAAVRALEGFRGLTIR